MHQNPQNDIESVKSVRKDIPKSGSSRNIYNNNINSNNKSEEYDSDNEFKSKKKINDEFYLPVIDEDTSCGVKIKRVNRKSNRAQSKSPILRKKNNNDENDNTNNSFKICKNVNFIIYQL